MSCRTELLKIEKKAAARRAPAGVNRILREAYARYARDRATQAAVKRMLGSARALAR